MPKVTVQKCPRALCGGLMVLRQIPKMTPPLFYGCTNFPICKARAGAHPDGSPMGTPAQDEEEMSLRIECHDIARTIWKWSDKHAKNKMYAWIRRNSKRGHIGQMNREELIELRAKLLAYHDEFEEYS